MANSQQVDYYISQIMNLQKLIAAIDGVQPILISIGDYKLPVDPIQFPSAYAAGAEVIKSVTFGAINDYKSFISEAIIAQAQADDSDASGTGAQPEPSTGSTGATGDSTGTSETPASSSTTGTTSEPSSSSNVTTETTTTNASSPDTTQTETPTLKAVRTKK